MHTKKTVYRSILAAVLILTAFAGFVLLRRSNENASSSSAGQPIIPAVEDDPLTAEIDYTVLPEDALQKLGTNREEYRRFIAALQEGAKSFSFSGTAAKDAILEAFSFCPLSAWYTTESINLTAQIYLSADGDEKIRAFGEICSSILADNLYACCTQTERCALLYRYVSANLSFVEEQSSAAVALTDYQADSLGYCRALAFLLLQVRVPCRIETACFVGTEHHILTVTLNEEAYFLDPTMENGSTGGQGLFCFGLSSQKAGERGLQVENCTPCTEEGLSDILQNALQWRLDYTQHILYYAGADGSFSHAVYTDTMMEAVG